MNSAEFYLSAMDVVQWLFDPKDKPALKYNEIILENNKRILDISLKNPQQEDENYQESIIVRNNIRRGNSLLVFISNNYKIFEQNKPKTKKKERNQEESNLFVSNKLTIDVIDHAN